MAEANVILAQPIVADITAVAPLGDDITARCMSMAVIDSQETADAAGKIIKDASRVEAQILEYINPVVEQAHKAHKAATTLRTKLTGFKEHVTALNQRLGRYLSEEKRKADMARMEAERIAREEQHRLIAEQEARALEAAAKLEAEGKHVQAQVALQAAAKPVAPVLVQPTPEAPKVAGIHLRDNWKWRVVNDAAVPREFLQLNESMIGAIVRNQKDKTKIAGIEVYNEPTPVNR